MRVRARTWIVAAFVTVLGLGIGMGVAWTRGMRAITRQPIAAPTDAPMEPKANTRKPDAVVGAVIAMTPTAYQPATVTVRKGEAVEFRNEGNGAQRPAAGGDDAAHELDADGFVPPGASWYAVMTREGEFAFYDAVYPQLIGKVIVR